MNSPSFVCVPALAWAALLAAPASAQAPGGEKPPPGLQGVSYGPHERNVFDLWLPKAGQPTPLVLFIHGGGFKGGDKSGVNPGNLRQYLSAGWAVASINYRLTNTAPAPAAYLDCGRALQHLRHHAKQWRIDPKRIASTGSSAGAGTSLWLAFHDDLADPKSTDPIARESTRLTCVVVIGWHTSVSGPPSDVAQRANRIVSNRCRTASCPPARSNAKTVPNWRIWRLARSC